MPNVSNNNEKSQNPVKKLFSVFRTNNNKIEQKKWIW